MTKANVFDYDGVIADSMTLKLDAYCYALEEFNPDRAEMREIQLREAGLPRTGILKIMYTKITGKEMPNEVFGRVSAKFARFEEKSLPKLKLFEDTVRFIEENYSRFTNAIITGTPQRVIDQHADHFGIRKYFHDIYGTPGTKIEHLTNFMTKYNLNPSEVILIGDTFNDQRTANQARVRFIAYDPHFIFDQFDLGENRFWMKTGRLTEISPAAV